MDIEVLERNDESASVLVTAKLKGVREFGPVTQRSRVIVLDHFPAAQNDPPVKTKDEETGNERKN